MQKLSGPASGKSGEFFFVTHDSRLILKTIKSSELHTLKKICKIQGNYIYNHPDSFIAKVYGIYSFTMNNTTNYIMMMKNLTLGLPRT